MRTQLPHFTARCNDILRAISFLLGSFRTHLHWSSQTREVASLAF